MSEYYWCMTVLTVAFSNLILSLVLGTIKEWKREQAIKCKKVALPTARTHKRR